MHSTTAWGRESDAAAVSQDRRPRVGWMPHPRTAWRAARQGGPAWVVAVYLGLVVTPVLAAAGLLWRAGARSPAPGGEREAAGLLAPAPEFARILLAVTLTVAACLAAGTLVRRLGQPAVLGEISCGILLGPSVLGALWPAGSAWILPATALDHLGFLAQLGAVLFVFLAGVDLNPGLLRGQGRLAVVVSHVGIAVPLLLGVLLALSAHGRFAPPNMPPAPFALFMGAAMSVTALPVMVRILTETGWRHSRVGAIALTCAMVDDVTVWCLLALLVALVGAATLTSVLATAVLAGSVAAVLLLGGRPLMRRAAAGTAAGAVPAVLAGLLLTAVATEWAGVHAVFGAFLYGLLVPSASPLGAKLHSTVDGFLTALLLPLFFAYNGLRTHIGLLGLDTGLWAWCAVIVLVGVGGKLAGSAFAARVIGADRRQALQLGALMNCRGLTELLVLNIGLDLGVIGPTLFTMMVIMALLSTAMTAPIMRWLGSPPDHHANPDRQPVPARRRER